MVDYWIGECTAYYNRTWSSYKAGFGDASGGNWIGDSIVDYSRTWSSYKAGFGDASGDNWFGKCTVNYITERGVPTRLDLVMPPEITGSVNIQLTI